ncbi:MAG: hypothetical protein RIT81_04235 [Deltaproteobacteria bacterium]
MTPALPKDVERRALARATRRAKLKGYTIILIYVVILVVLFPRNAIGVFGVACSLGGLVVAVRHVKAAHILERDGPREQLHAETHKLVEEIESEALRASALETAAGSVSVFRDPARGGLAVAEPIDGHLALTAPAAPSNRRPES